ncbi:uracil-DNA glycosylase [Sphingomonas soli]|uniref:uracil-DNA glycosylase n=1 Tax=Sphingomonas soli TaxID=266127 RepID=UPI001FDEEADF|nr:uracil-DNA glycosylase [Sphingomonas soli]
MDKLSSVRLPNVFNPYRDICNVHDRAEGPSIRAENLRQLIEASLKTGVETMWVGRDLGYLGGRRTGIALTDELRLATYSSYFGELNLRKATKGVAIGERTATVTWEMLQRIRQPVFLWNAFPLHPHDAGNPFTNRCHTRAERQACKPLLIELIGLLKPKTVVAIGNDAEAAMLDMGINTVRVRHPSYGGKADFISGLNRIYGLKPQPRAQHELSL